MDQLDEVLSRQLDEMLDRRKRGLLGNEFDWTRDRLERLIELLADKWTTRKIADDLGCTRMAVIGKINRMREAGILPKWERPPPKIKATRKKRTSWQPKERPKLDPSNDPRNDLPPDDSPFACTLVDVQPHQCRWPLNNAGPDFRFCGAEKINGSSYCYRHHQTAHATNKNFSDDTLDMRVFSVRKRWLAKTQVLNRLTSQEEKAA